ncbi:hypothetical protein GmRootA79_03990 [Acidovorax sp. A79]|uniref:hypothetical protein n=1 Tax=Acidovorax sp. A79 TaxID=3056107 RepID=UPI0034E84C7B
MNLSENYKQSIALAHLGNFSQLNEFIDQLQATNRFGQELDDLIACACESYDDASCSLKITILSMLYKLDEEVAYKMARNDLKEVYKAFRDHGSHLHQVIFSIVRHDNIDVATSSIEYDKNMRIAFALINKLNVNDFIDK